VSLSPHERRALDCISQGLTSSDPVLAALLETFGKLTDGEVMPAREQTGPNWRRARGAARRARTVRSGRRARGRLDPARIAIFAWLLISLLFVSLAVAFSSGGATSCRAPLVMGCSGTAPSSPGTGHQEGRP
jgi:hypothetical protein